MAKTPAARLRVNSYDPKECVLEVVSPTGKIICRSDLTFKSEVYARRAIPAFVEAMKGAIADVDKNGIDEVPLKQTRTPGGKKAAKKKTTKKKAG